MPFPGGWCQHERAAVSPASDGGQASVEMALFYMTPQAHSVGMRTTWLQGKHTRVKSLTPTTCDDKHA